MHGCSKLLRLTSEIEMMNTLYLANITDAMTSYIILTCEPEKLHDLR